MNYITVKLTVQQAVFVANILSEPNWVQDQDNSSKSDPHNRFIQRIADKIYKELAKAKNS